MKYDDELVKRIETTYHCLKVGNERDLVIINPETGRGYTSREIIKSLTEIKEAKTHDIGVTAVRRILLGRERFTTQLTNSRKNNLRKDYNLRRGSVAEIAQKYKISKSSVYDVLYELANQGNAVYWIKKPKNIRGQEQDAEPNTTTAPEEKKPQAAVPAQVVPIVVPQPSSEEEHNPKESTRREDAIPEPARPRLGKLEADIIQTVYGRIKGVPIYEIEGVLHEILSYYNRIEVTPEYERLIDEVEGLCRERYQYSTEREEISALVVAPQKKKKTGLLLSLAAAALFAVGGAYAVKTLGDSFGSLEQTITRIDNESAKNRSKVNEDISYIKKEINELDEKMKKIDAPLYLSNDELMKEVQDHPLIISIPESTSVAEATPTPVVEAIPTPAPTPAEAIPSPTPVAEATEEPENLDNYIAPKKLLLNFPKDKVSQGFRGYSINQRELKENK